ncbi:hypothetical protein MKK63_09110 [Methylobacterium sp. J-088]|uniref:hypothetical protein n=1 Tax=Methylobacterium sp. J-088 TaxID=2836664 RepID=UPI001FB89CB9|nr:hypothetical protein [Methylobacterium sp. J-088]MCJ2062866.1 hypothetical protein [Methylobacterium sp. J-088]
MDMPTPEDIGAPTNRHARDQLDRLAQALACSSERFYETQHASGSKDAAHLIQMWLALKRPEARDMVLTLVNELLKAEAGKVFGSKADLL